MTQLGEKGAKTNIAATFPMEKQSTHFPWAIAGVFTARERIFYPIGHAFSFSSEREMWGKNNS